MLVGCLRAVSLHPTAKFSLLWDAGDGLDVTACNVSPGCFWQKTKGKRKEGRKKKGNIKVNFWNFSSEMNCLCGDQFFLSFLIFLNKKISVFFCIFALSWLLRTARLIEFATGDIQWTWWILWMQDLGLLEPSFLDVFFFSLMTLWKQVYPLQQTERWVVLFDILHCYMPVYKNANDNHGKGHLDYCRASLSCLFLSGLLSLHLFPNLSSLHLEFDS